MRHATARFHDVAQAEAEGYVDIGLFFPNMSWHYLKTEPLDDRFEPEYPELLAYADDPCGGTRQRPGTGHGIRVLAKIEQVD